MKKILVTGAAGFIGFHVSKKLISLGYTVIGIDNLLPYYDVGLKKARLREMGLVPAAINDDKKIGSVLSKKYHFIKIDVADRKKIDQLFAREKFDAVIHLAAQPGVRESINNPYQYIDSNINGYITVLEACRNYPVKHLVSASSSSVYGNNKKVPFSESDRVDSPISLYAATKKSGELMAYTYAHLYDIPISSLRFFTVYGPWGRPDMAYYKFADAILEGRTIDVYNQGELYRDFTYVDDVVEGLIKLLKKPPTNNPPYSILNIGNASPVKLMEFIGVLEELLQKKAIINTLPMQAGDVYTTYAEVEKLDELVGFKPQTNIRDGLKHFVDWYMAYHKKN